MTGRSEESEGRGLEEGAYYPKDDDVNLGFKVPLTLVLPRFVLKLSENWLSSSLRPLPFKSQRIKEHQKRWYVMKV